MQAVSALKKIGTTLAGVSLAGAVWAQDSVDATLPELETLGIPNQDGYGFQAPATQLMTDVIALDTFLLWIITIISVFVTGLLLYCCFVFNAKRNKKPATFTHNSVLEVAWTVVPIIVLIIMIPPSLTLLFDQQEIPEADITIKATGNQWYWTHEYVDHDFGFDSFMLPKEDLAANGYEQDEYLLATDTAVVVPTGKVIVVQVTGADVIHAWTIPAFGVKQDAVPGRLAQLWFEVDEGKEGIYFGQCSELCGKAHSYMPITVKAVSQADYDTWLASAKAEYAEGPVTVKVADANMIKVLEAEAAN
ncbi:MAG: cytochrome c oxidase subunit II [Amylibacter sp.]